MWRGRIAARGVPTGGSEQCPQPKIAVAIVEREFPVQRNGSEYFVDIPYHFTVATQVRLGGKDNIQRISSAIQKSFRGTMVGARQLLKWSVYWMSFQQGK